jgi:hypothetical protein
MNEPGGEKQQKSPPIIAGTVEKTIDRIFTGSMGAIRLLKGLVQIFVCEDEGEEEAEEFETGESGCFEKVGLFEERTESLLSEKMFHLGWQWLCIKGGIWYHRHEKHPSLV